MWGRARCGGPRGHGGRCAAWTRRNGTRRRTDSVRGSWRPAAHGLRRGRLLARLRAAERLTVVVAPAGSGKTTLLAQHAEHAPGPVVWHRAGRQDGDAARLAAALLRVAGAASAREPPPRELAEALAAGSAPVTLVVDDAHLLLDTPAEDYLERLVAEGPGRAVGAARLPAGTRAQPVPGRAGRGHRRDRRRPAVPVVGGRVALPGPLPRTAPARRHRRADPPHRRVGRLPAAVPAVHPRAPAARTPPRRRRARRRPALRALLPRAHHPRRAAGRPAHVPGPDGGVRGPHGRALRAAARRPCRRGRRDPGRAGPAREAGTPGGADHLRRRWPLLPLPRGAARGTWRARWSTSSAPSAPAPGTRRRRRCWRSRARPARRCARGCGPSTGREVTRLLREDGRTIAAEAARVGPAWPDLLPPAFVDEDPWLSTAVARRLAAEGRLGAAARRYRHAEGLFPDSADRERVARERRLVELWTTGPAPAAPALDGPAARGGAPPPGRGRAARHRARRPPLRGGRRAPARRRAVRRRGGGPAAGGPGRRRTAAAGGAAGPGAASTPWPAGTSRPGPTGSTPRRSGPGRPGSPARRACCTASPAATGRRSSAWPTSAPRSRTSGASCWPGRRRRSGGCSRASRRRRRASTCAPGPTRSARAGVAAWIAAVGALAAAAEGAPDGAARARAAAAAARACGVRGARPSRRWRRRPPCPPPRGSRPPRRPAPRPPSTACPGPRPSNSGCSPAGNRRPMRWASR